MLRPGLWPPYVIMCVSLAPFKFKWFNSPNATGLKNKSRPPIFGRMTQHLAAAEDEFRYEKPKAPQCETVISPSKFVEMLDNCAGEAGG